MNSSVQALTTYVEAVALKGDLGVQTRKFCLGKKEHRSDTVCSKIFPIFEKERSFAPFKNWGSERCSFLKDNYFLLQTVSELRSFFPSKIITYLIYTVFVYN